MSNGTPPPSTNPLPVPGPDPAYFQPGPHPTVPYEVGATQDAARAAMTQAGYPPATQTVPSTKPAGTVVGQTPQGTVARGATVTVRVSIGPAG